MQPKIAIVCDWLVSRGGAERVTIALSDMFPHAPIYTSLYNARIFPELASRDVHTSFIQRIPFALKKHQFMLPLMPYAFESFDLSAYDIVISACHSAAKGIITKPRTLHICYCHTPMRYAWDNCHEYFERYGIPAALRSSAKRMLSDIRLWDRLAADRVDKYIANSSLVSCRIKKYYRRDSKIIYPPVDIGRFRGVQLPKTRNYFLAVGRLIPYKRFDLLVDASNELGIPLIIAGTGKELDSLKKRAGRFVTFTGHIKDEELGHLYAGARALLFPQEEDFGITPLEAMACGTPVIAYSRGGALETINPGITGLFFEQQAVESLKKALLEFEAFKWDRATIRAHAAKFDRPIFERSIKEFIEEEWGKWTQG